MRTAKRGGPTGRPSQFETLSILAVARSPGSNSSIKKLPVASEALPHPGSQASSSTVDLAQHPDGGGQHQFKLGASEQWSKSMKQMHLMKLAIAGSTVACATLFSFSWSEQRGVSLSVESVQARVGRPLTPMSVAGVSRRQNRRAGYGYGAGVVGAGVAGAAALGTAAAVAATSPNWGWGSGPYYTGAGNYGYTGVSPSRGGSSPSYYGGGYAANAYYPAPAAGPIDGWYIAPSGGMACTSGALITGANGLPFRCP
jgi:hypothetical protein